MPGIAQWNPSTVRNTLAVSGGGLVATQTPAAFDAVASYWNVTTGKWYFELEITGASSSVMGGIATAEFIANTAAVSLSTTAVATDDHRAFIRDLVGQGVHHAVDGTVSSVGTISPEWQLVNDVLGVAFDADTGKTWFRVNGGSWQGGGDPAAGTSPSVTMATGHTYHAACSMHADEITANFGPTFGTAAPSGFAAVEDGALHATGDLTATPALDGAATNNTKHATGDLTAAPALDGTATNSTKHAAGDLTATPALGGTAFREVHAAGDLTAAPALSSTGAVSYDAVGAFESPTSVLAATVLPGYVVTGAFVAPVATVVAEQAPYAEFAAALPDVAGTVLAGTISTAALTAPESVVLATAAVAHDITGALLAGDTVVAATMLGGSVATAAIDALETTLDATALAGTVGAASLEAPSVELLATLLQESLCAAAFEAPSVEVLGIVDNDFVATYLGWSVNTESFGATNYDDAAYIALIDSAVGPLAVTADGVLLMQGATDEGAAIDSEVRFGFTDFGEDALKTVPYCYFGYRSAGDLSVLVSVDGEPAVRTYSLPRTTQTSGIKPARTKLASGLRARYWQIGVANVAGADFELDTVQPLVGVLKREDLMASTTVTEIIDSTNADIVALTAEARAFINQLRAILDTDFNVNIPGGRQFSFSYGGGMYEALQSLPARPDDFVFNSPQAPGAVPTPSVRDATQVDVPDFASTPPVFNLPDRPEFTLPVDPVAPDIAAVALPDAPTLTLPAAPTLATVNLPEAPSLTLPVFDRAFPETPDLLLRTSEFDYVESEYSSELLVALQTKLLGDVRDGGYGIESRDESALWERARDREVQAGLAEEATAEQRFAGRGYMLAPGVAVEAVLRASRNVQDKVSELNREITVTRAELFRKTREMAIEKGIALEQVLTQLHGFAQERALNAARISAEFAITVFDALVRKHNAIVAAHQAHVAVYSEQVRAVATQTEIFRTQVEAAISQHRGNEQAVAVYNSQLQAAGLLTNLYRSQLEAAQVSAVIEQTKLETFRARVQAFVAQVSARTAQADFYRTAVQGESAKAQIYQSEVAAYVGRVQAAEANARIQNINTQADIERAKIDLAAYNAQVDKYRADLTAEVERVRSLAEVYSTDADMYKAVLSGWEALFNLNSRASETFLRTVQEDTRLEQNAAQIKLGELVSETEFRLKAALAGTELYKDLLASKSSVASAIAIREE